MGLSLTVGSGLSGGKGLSGVEKTGLSCGVAAVMAVFGLFSMVTRCVSRVTVRPRVVVTVLGVVMVAALCLLSFFSFVSFDVCRVIGSGIVTLKWWVRPVLFVALPVMQQVLSR